MGIQAPHEPRGDLGEDQLAVVAFEHLQMRDGPFDAERPVHTPVQLQNAPVELGGVLLGEHTAAVQREGGVRAAGDAVEDREPVLVVRADQEQQGLPSSQRASMCSSLPTTNSSAMS